MSKENEKQEVYKPRLKPRISNHYEKVWFDKECVELKTSKSGKQYFIIGIQGNDIMFGEKAFINKSEKGDKMGFHVQVSREYRIFGTSEMILGKDLIQYQIQLNMFIKQEKEKEELLKKDKKKNKK